MIPTDFPESNMTFKSPPDMPGTCEDVRGYMGQVKGGPFDGAQHTVVAWQPTEEEIHRMANGEPIYLSVIGNLPPHYLCMSYEEAVEQ